FLVGFRGDVVNVDGAAIDDGPARYGLPRDRERLGERNRAGPRPMPCRNTQDVPVDAGNYDVRSLTEPGGILNDRLEHRSEVCGRARDHMQDLSRCRCCSSASVRSRLRVSSSLKSRTFSIAMTA